jgi:UDP-glucose 4-epimerase
VLEVIRATERISGVEVPTEMTGRRAGDPVATFAAPGLAQRLLGWSATRDLDDIIASAWRWHSTHPDGYAG